MLTFEIMLAFGKMFLYSLHTGIEKSIDLFVPISQPSNNRDYLLQHENDAGSCPDPQLYSQNIIHTASSL
jgi:hypothetical protein